MFWDLWVVTRLGASDQYFGSFEDMIVGINELDAFERLGSTSCREVIQ
jgi:hypothetical protein